MDKTPIVVEHLVLDAVDAATHTHQQRQRQFAFVMFWYHLAYDLGRLPEIKDLERWGYTRSIAYGRMAEFKRLFPLFGDPLALVTRLKLDAISNG